MGITRLVRKAKKNRTVSRQRVNSIKRLTSKPVIKNVDIEQIKADFANKKIKPAIKKETPAKETPAKEAPKAEVSTPKKKEVKKAAPKKETPKAKEVSGKKSTKKDDKAAE